MLYKFEESGDKGNEFGALLIDLSKAFDCIDHKLLIAKLVSPLSLNLIFSYLSNRTQRVKLKQVTVIKVVSNIEFHKAQFYDHYYLTLISLMSSLNVMILKLQVMPIIQLHTLVLTTYLA